MASSSSSKSKRQEEKYVQMIRELASLPMNKQCFDCNSKGPTYVDVTVGSFVCTTCSGLLRGLNPPHRVKSINMSTFTQDEVEFLRNHGNQLNKMIYLSLYDANAGFSPDPKDTDRFKEFLCQKYERKRWYAEPTEAMKQKVKADLESSLEKTTQQKVTSTSHSQSINTSIKSPPEPSAKVTRAHPVSTSQQPPMLVFDAPVSTTSNTSSSTSILDDFFQPTKPAASNPSPTTNFFPDQPFASTTGTSNDNSWGAFVETSKPATSHTLIPNSASQTSHPSFPNNNSAHPPPEPADKYAALSELFSSQNTGSDHQPSIFANTTNGASRPTMGNSNNSIFSNAPFSSPPSAQSSTTKFPSPQSNNLFPAAPFTSHSNPFVQQPFAANSTNLFNMPPANQPNPFLGIAQQPQPSQPFPQQFGKPRANSTNPFL